MAFQAPRRIILRPLPKIVFLYPTLILAIVCALWSQFGGERFVKQLPAESGAHATADAAGGANGDGSAATGSETAGAGGTAEAPAPRTLKGPPRWLGNTFMIVFLLNMIVFSFDFPRTRGLVLLLGGIALILFLVHFEVIGPLAELFQKLQPFADAQFYTALALFMGLIGVLVLIHTRFNYFEIEGNSIIHHTGFLGKSRRYPTPNLRRQLEITDVFEFFLLRSGKYIFYPSQEQEALVLDVVPGILSKDKQIELMMGVVKMDAIEDDARGDSNAL